MFRKSYFISFNYSKDREAFISNAVLRIWFMDYPKNLKDIQEIEMNFKNKLNADKVIITNIYKL